MVIKYEKGTVFESGNTYKAELAVYDFTPSDAQISRDEDYLAPSTAAGDQLAIAFILKDLHDVTIDFGGAELVFHGRIAPFVLDGCKNITIKNCKINYDRPYYTEAHILEADTRHLRIKIAKDFPCRVEDGYLIAESEYWENRLNRNNLLLQPYDAESHTPAFECILALIGKEIFPHPSLPLPCHHLVAESDGDDVILRAASDAFPRSWKAGYDLVITHESRDKNTFTAVGCENVTLENVRILHGASLGFVGMHTKGITLLNFSMYRDEEHPHLVTNNADAVHCFNCSGHILLENCRMDSMLDDALNVHTNFSLADHTEDNKLYAYNASRHVSIRNKIYMPGDKIAVYNGATMEEKAVYTVKAISTDRKSLYILELDETPTGIQKGDLIENLGGQADVTVRNCTFGRFRGMLRLQSRGNILIENSTFSIGGTEIAFTGDTTYWHEGSPVRNVLIRNCSFTGSIAASPEINATEKAPYYHKNIRIENCHFKNANAFYANNTDGIVLSGNTCDEGKITVRLRDCGSCEADENCVVVR